MLRRMLRVSCGADVDVAGHDVAVAGFEQDVVERDALVRDAVVHGRRLPEVVAEGFPRL